jgi:hypothetical protein
MHYFMTIAFFQNTTDLNAAQMRDTQYAGRVQRGLHGVQHIFLHMHTHERVKSQLIFSSATVG